MDGFHFCHRTGGRFCRHRNGFHFCRRTGGCFCHRRNGYFCRRRGGRFYLRRNGHFCGRSCHYADGRFCYLLRGAWYFALFRGFLFFPDERLPLSEPLLSLLPASALQELSALLVPRSSKRLCGLLLRTSCQSVCPADRTLRYASADVLLVSWMLQILLPKRFSPLHLLRTGG